jgi:hypothetical protein
MKQPTQKFTALSLALGMALAPAAAQTSATPKKKTAASPRTSKMEREMQQVLDQLKQQQQEINTLQQQLQVRDQQLQAAQQAAQQAQTQAQQAATQNNQAYQSLKSAVQSVQAENTQTKTDLVQTKADVEAVRQMGAGFRENYANPIALKYKQVYITPGGFLAAETVFRQRATGGGLNTPFNAIPFSASALARQTEFVATGRQSRITLNVQGRVDHATIGGYYEADFLNAGSTSNNNESNSYPLRQRQMWARYQRDTGFTVVGGQMWSFLTETVTGFENKTEAIPYTIDPQYTPGFIWARQYGMRIYDNINRKLFAGVAFENPQMTFGGHGYTNNFTFGTAGNPGGLLNPDTNYSINMAPDIIAKVAVEPGFGHYEVGGIATFLRDRVYPNAGSKTDPAANAYNDKKVAGAVEAAAWLPFHKGLYNLGVRGMYGQSVGRYGASTLPDTTVRPDGQLAPLRNLSALASLEMHPGKWDLYYYYGGDYAGKNWTLNSAGKPVGYGSPLFVNSGCATETAPSSSPYGPGALANCTGDTRALTAHDAGFWYNFYRGSKGKLVYGMQYDYMVRNTWAGIGGQPKAIDNMFWTSFRYYIP